jgi:hypothetical protein
MNPYQVSIKIISNFRKDPSIILVFWLRSSFRAVLSTKEKVQTNKRDNFKRVNSGTNLKSGPIRQLAFPVPRILGLLAGIYYQWLKPLRFFLPKWFFLKSVLISLELRIPNYFKKNRWNRMYCAIMIWGLSATTYNNIGRFAIFIDTYVSTACKWVDIDWPMRIPCVFL